MVDKTQALSFGRAAERYDAIRPSYPMAAVRTAAGESAHRVVDLGAGTGILTRLLIDAGYETVPVEPDGAMRDRLAEVTPGTVALAGSAEKIPLPDGSVDTVVAGQAYHWFEPEKAHPEIARVLRPGGAFAAIWNVRDESVDWVAELTRAASMTDGGQHAAIRIADFGPLFGPIERATFHHSVTHTADSLVALVASRSYYLTAPAARQAEMAAGARRVAQQLGRETFELPYLTYVCRAVKR